MKLKICLLILLCLIFRVSAQTTGAIKTLDIGDKLPDFQFTDIVNYPKSTLRFSDFKGKNIIIDFWATYCTSCLAHFKLSDSLQREFGHDLQFVLVDGPYHTETLQRVLSTIRRFDANGRQFSLPSIINDSTLIPLFPHYTIPHYVWIDKTGTIKAITAGEDITRQNIANFLKWGKTPEYEKKDFDRERPLYTTKELPLDKLERFSIFLKGKIEGIGNGGIRQINDTARGIILHNRSLLAMYQRMVQERITGITDNRLVLDVADSSKLTYMPRKSSFSDWQKSNLYSYELIVPANEMGNLFNDVLDELNHYTPFHAGMEKRIEACYVLERSDIHDRIHTTGGQSENSLTDDSAPQLMNCPLLRLCEYIYKIGNNAVILDDTGYKKYVDLKFTSPVKNIESLTKALSEYGLKLTATMRSVDMLVIKDK